MTEERAGTTGERLRVLQVGAGGMGRAWLTTIGRSTEVELVGLVDLDLTVARAAADESGFAHVEVATSVGELAARTGAQAVINVTVPQAHHPVNTEAMRAGLPVLCEKPLSESLTECLSMVAVSELTSQLLMVSQSRRYWRHLVALRQQLSALGPVGVATCEFAKAPHFGGFRETMKYPLLVDMAIHQFDLSRDLVGSEPVAVFCESYNPAWSWYGHDAATVTIFRFASGARFTFTGSWCSPGQETSWNGAWRLTSEGGTATWDGDNPPHAQLTDETVLPVVSSDAPETTEGSLAEFVAALRDGDVPTGEVHSNVLSTTMVQAAIESATTGQWVELADVLERAHADNLASALDPDVRAVMEGWTSIRQLVGLPA